MSRPGLLLVASAGNSGADIARVPRWPASYNVDTLLTVEARRYDGALSKKSNHGCGTVDIGAPAPERDEGPPICSTDVAAATAGGCAGDYAHFDRTSAAAAVVSGAAALVWREPRFAGCSAVYGYTEVGWKTALDALTAFDGSKEHIIVLKNRVPRALIGAAVGMSLAIAGALLQGLTRNPLASPDIFGINAGAGFAIVLSAAFFSVSSIHQFAWVAFLGAACTTVIVYLLGGVGAGGLTPVKLTLAG